MSRRGDGWERRGRLAFAAAAAATGCLAMMWAAAGCASSPGGAGGSSGSSGAPATLAAATTAAAATTIIGTSTDGRSIPMVQLGDGEATVLLVATIHGDEAAGTALLQRLEDRLRREPWRLARRTVLLVPDANPDGRVADRRGTAAGVDLNRDFPADNRTPGRPAAPTQPESRALLDLILRRAPDLVVSIHQPLACVDWDGPPPAAAIAMRMAERSRLPARKLGARNGSLGAWAGETLGIPVITLELPRDAGLDAAADWDRYAAALLEAVLAAPEAAAARAAAATTAPRQSAAPTAGD